MIRKVDMEVEDLKWYSPFVLFVGAILSFADPITDIFTLKEFYRTEHKTWFGVGLTFILLPCFVFPVLFFLKRESKHSPSDYAKTILCAFHPFSAAFARLEAFIFCIKRGWFNFEIDGDSTARAGNVLSHIAYAVLFEAVLESAPQFTIQLYAISVQEEPATIIQMISLPVSFLTLVWAFAATDEWTLVKMEIIPDISVLKKKHRVALYVTHVLLLSSRLFAICYFTVSYKWWVIGVLSFHSSVVVVTIFILQGHMNDVFLNILFMGIHCLRDDVSAFSNGQQVGVGVTILLSNFLFILENCSMILISYFTYYVKIWYFLHVTIFVCLFSVLGSTIRIALLLSAIDR